MGCDSGYIDLHKPTHIPLMKTLIAITTAAALISLSPAATVSISSTAPTVDADDISNLTTATGGANLWGDRKIQAQTFTTGSNSAGYELNSVTIQVYDGDGDLDLKDFFFRVSNWDSGSRISSAIDGHQFARSANIVNDDYITMALDTPATLSADTTYIFEVAVRGSSTGWQSSISKLRTTDNNYTGGSRFESGSNYNTYTNPLTTDINYGTATSNDILFEADMTALSAVPEPSAALLGMLGMLLLLRRRSGTGS